MGTSEDSPSIELVKVAAKGARRVCRLSVDGLDLVTASGPEGKALKSSTTSFPDAPSAIRGYDKALRAKLRDGFAYLRDPAETPVGGVVLHAFASGAGAGTLGDLSVDGRRAVTVGSDAKLTKYEVELVDVATGARETVLETSTATEQGFVHTVFFDATGEAVFVAARTETLRLDLGTRAVTRVAGYREGATAKFNPHVVRPHTDASRRRVVVFDEGTMVRVLDHSLKTLFAVCTDSPTTECRAAAISPSGRLLAVYRVSRGIVYGHDDARRDETCVVDVWEVDSGALRTTLASAHKLERVGFSPDDTQLVVTREYAQGPVGIDLATGEERWRFDDPSRDDRLAIAYCWRYSPDGALLAVGSGDVELYDARSRAPVPVERVMGYRLRSLRFSGDGRWLMAAGDGSLVVRRIG